MISNILNSELLTYEHISRVRCSSAREVAHCAKFGAAAKLQGVQMRKAWERLRLHIAQAVISFVICMALRLVRLGK